jgi:small nuclear ribonucleoprotein (snRNP)-like protein
MSAVASRRFFDELGLLIEKPVRVEDDNGNTYDGVLLAFDGGSLSVVLGDVAGEQGTKIHRIFIYGSTITKISASERPFNLQGLVERLERVFPNMTRIFHDAGVIVVMDKIRVNESGVIEGSGPAADRVRDIYQRFVSEAS